ncbi:MAG: hypothetical protein J6X55_01545 [Victivallales bacterium]|nr:hypothetical protein [Victivallales bacterium]
MTIERNAKKNAGQFVRRVDPIAPVSLNNDTYTPEFLRMIRERFGIRRFAMFGYGPKPGLPLNGYPSLEDFKWAGEKLLRYKKELADTDIEIIWWCHPTIKVGLNVPYQHIVNYDGTVSNFGLCPLDPRVRKDLAERIACVAKIADLSLVMIEDDYELSNHPGVTFGCFCPLHLAAFSKKAGREYTREELVAMFKEDKRETKELRKLFWDTSRESLCQMAAEIRAEVDKVSPSIRIGVCEPGTTDYDGYITIDESRAFSGPNTRPLVRVYGTQYSCTDSPQYLPGTMGHTMYTAERLPEDFEWMHETDTYPGTTFYMSAAFMETEINGALAMGADNTYFYGIQGADDDDFAHFEMYARNAKRFEALREAACSRSGHFDGCRVIHSPLTMSLKKMKNEKITWFQDICAMLARLGIPYSTRYGSPAILVGDEAEALSDNEVLELLKGGLLLDFPAAEILEQRGFSDLIGVTTERLTKYAFNGENLADGIPEFADITRRKMRNGAYDPAGTEGAYLGKPMPIPGAEVLTWYCKYGEPVQPGMVRFTNRLGGRVCVIACSLSGNLSSNLLNYRKQRVLRIVFNWLRGSKLPAAVEGSNTWLLVRNTPSGTLFCVTALGADGRKDVTLVIDEKYNSSDFEELDDEGQWHPADIERLADDRLVLKGDFKNLRMRVFRAK